LTKNFESGFGGSYHSAKSVREESYTVLCVWMSMGDCLLPLHPLGNKWCQWIGPEKKLNWLVLSQDKSDPICVIFTASW